MGDGLFSGFVMVEPGAAAAPSDGANGRPSTQAASTEGSVVQAAMSGLSDGRAVHLRLNPDLGATDLQAVRTFMETIVRVTANLDASRQEAAIAKLADIILPDRSADARGALAADNLTLRDRFISETAPLTSAEVGSRAGHARANPYATAARWKKSGDVFSVHHRGTEYFPAFLFREGRPHPTVKKALAALPASLSPWQRAFWFVSANGWLGDRAPADLLDDAEAVVAAARQEGRDVIG